MFVFILANLPLPVILYLNWRVTIKFWRIHHLSKHAKIKKPKELVIGWWLSNSAIIFALIPVISERRIFVQDVRWLGSFAISATLTITGLILMNSGLGEELEQLVHPAKPQPAFKPVDIEPSDTL
jgi:hypothetical protein